MSDVIWLLDAVDDFLKGPEFLMKPEGRNNYETADFKGKTIG